MAHAYSYNIVILLGKTGRPPVKYRCKGKNPVDYAFFSLCTMQKFSRGQTKKSWHNIQCWGNRWAAWVEKYVGKGNTLFIKGMLDTRVRVDPDNPERKIYDTFVRAEEIIFVCSGERKTKAEVEEEEPEEEETQEDSEDDEEGMF